MNKTKRLAINMFAQIVAFATNFLVSFFLTPYIVESIGAEAYGFVGLANNFINYATVITTALNSMVSRFVTISMHQEKYEETNKYMTSVIIANLCLAIPLTILVTLLLVFLKDIVQVPENIVGDVTLLWGLLFANFVIGLIGNVFSVATFSQNRLDLSSRRSIESNILKVIILIVAFFFFEPSVWYLGLSTLLCGIYTIVTNIYFTRRLLPFVKIRKRYIDFTKIKILLSSGIWNSVSAFSKVLSTELDLLITNLFVGATSMGVVSVAKTLPTYILSLFAMFTSVFTPQLTISYAKNKLKEFYYDLIGTMRFLAFFACIPMACIYAYGKEFFSLWVPTQDASLLQTLTILATAAYPFALPLEPLWNVFTITNKIKKSSLFLLMNSIVSIVLTFVFLGIVQDDVAKMYIVIGTSTILSVIRGLTFLPIYGAKCVNLKWYAFYPIIGRTTLAVISATLISLVIKKVIFIHNWITLILAGILTLAFSMVLNYFIILTSNERKKLREKILKRRIKL